MLVKCILFLLLIGILDAAGYRSLSNACPTPKIEHGNVRVRRSRVVKFICWQGYQLIGNKYATCRNGWWDVQLPVCIRPGCPMRTIENGLQQANYNDAWVYFFCMPGYKLVGSPAIYCDGQYWNASAPTCESTKAAPQLSCDFEDPNLCGWKQDELHDFDWIRLNEKTPSSVLLTGPSYDHTYGPGKTGYYMYIESTSRLENDTARFLSPIYDKSLSKEGCFSFYYHMYGQSTGGLRVYQKPDYLSLRQFLKLPVREIQKYTLFEKWGNMGDFWYRSVSKLTDFSDHFQIVMEGIRGQSYTSDIAIDDVAILQGAEECRQANVSASTPPPIINYSCEGRCETTNETYHGLGCGCGASCFLTNNCCEDFMDICIFMLDITLPDDAIQPNSSSELPQTQKLVASTTPAAKTTPKLTTTTESTTTTSTSTTTTTPKPSTQKATTTSTLPPTTSTTPKPTTIKITTKTTRRTTKLTTQSSTTTSRTTTTRRIPKTVTYVVTTTTAKATPKTTTNAPFGISRTIENHNDYKDMIEKAKKEHAIEVRTIVHHKLENHNNGSALKIAFILIGFAICIAGVLWLVNLARSEHGRISIARLRGRANDDSEVRYLSTDVEDDC